MQKIDLATWPRRERFLSYLGTDFPYIVLSARVDVTGLLRYCRQNGLSFYFALIYACTRTADAIEPFRYRFRDRDVFCIPRNVPVIVHLQKDVEQFVMFRQEPDGDLPAFCRRARAAADAAVVGERLDKGDDLSVISFSCMPWVDYTAMIRTIMRDGVDCNPKITWGRYTTENERTTLTLSVQVHHGLMDGLHVGRFYQHLQEYLDQFNSASAGK